MSKVFAVNEAEKKSYKRFRVILRILIAAVILFVLFILFALFLDSSFYMRVSRYRAVKTIKAADAVYINIEESRKKVSDKDFETLKSIWQTVECDAECDGRSVKWGCGFSDKFSIEFVDTDTGKSVFVDKAEDGCGGYTIDYNMYYFSNAENYDKISEITEKYGMRGSLDSSLRHAENEKS